MDTKLDLVLGKDCNTPRYYHPSRSFGVSLRGFFVGSQGRCGLHGRMQIRKAADLPIMIASLRAAAEAKQEKSGRGWIDLVTAYVEGQMRKS